MHYEKFASAVHTIDGTAKDMLALNTAVQDSFDATTENDISSTTISDFLNLPIGDKADFLLRKAMAAAIVLAQDKGIVVNPSSDAAELASEIDDGLTRVKTAYQVGIGKLSPEEAFDNIVDAAEARAITAVEQAFDSGTVNNAVTEGIVTLAHIIPKVGTIIGPLAEKCKPIISSVISRVEEPVKMAIKTGVHYVATTAKTFAKAALSTATSFTKSVAKRFRTLFA